MHTPEDMCWGHEEGTSPFVCAHRARVAWTERKLVHMKQILVHFCVVAGTVCESIEHDATLKIKLILSVLQDSQTS